MDTEKSGGRDRFPPRLNWVTAAFALALGIEGILVFVVGVLTPREGGAITLLLLILLRYLVFRLTGK